MPQTPFLKTQQMQVGGMDCPSCEAKIEAVLQKLAGVAEAAADVATGRLTVSYDPQQLDEAAIRNRVVSLGYTVATPQAERIRDHGHSHGHSHHGHSHEEHDGQDCIHHNKLDHTHYHAHNYTQDSTQNHAHEAGEFNLQREGLLIGTVAALLVLGSIFQPALQNTPYSIAEYAVFISAYLLSGWSVLKSAGRNILKGQIFDENFLMTIATVGAIAIHQLPEAVGVMLFFKIGEAFQAAALSNSRRSISALLEVRPDVAYLKTAHGIQPVSPETVKLGEIIVVKPGEKVPLDGEILTGSAQVDTAALTGESVPRTVQAGETVLAGMINQTGLLTIRVTKLFGEALHNWSMSQG